VFPNFSVSAFQHFSFFSVGCFPISAFQRFSISAFKIFPRPHSLLNIKGEYFVPLAPFCGQ
jgi:hypothetical protein